MDTSQATTPLGSPDPADARPRSERRWRTLLTRSDVALIALVALAGAFYFWTAATSGDYAFVDHQPNVYNLLADAFLHGHTYLPIHAPAGLLALHNPYDPVANAPYRAMGLHDLSLYHGRLYAYWGPAPALLLFLPWRLLPVGELPDPVAVTVFAVLALGFAILLLRLVVRRLLPSAPGWAVVLAGVAVAVGTAVPFLLRRPSVYEVAIAAGAFLVSAGLYFLARGSLRPVPRLWQLAVASLCFGLAFDSRPPLLVSGLALVAVAVLLPRRPGGLQVPSARLLTALFAPFLVCLALTGAYNAVRFGSPAEFGNKYQMAGIDVQKHKGFRLAYLPPGVYNYLVAPPRLALTFPHVFLPPPPGYPGTLPAGYDGSSPAQAAEPTGGLIPTAPIVAFLVFVPVLWSRLRRDRRHTPLALAGGLGVLGLIILVGLAFTLWGTTERYEVDFDLLLILGGVLAWLTVVCEARSPVRRRVAAVAGAAALLWTAACGVAVSFIGYYNALDTLHPRTFALLEDVTGPLATLPTMLLGRPVIARVQSTAPVALPPTNYATFGQGGAGVALGQGEVTLVILSPGSRDVALRANVAAGPALRPGAPLSMLIHSPGRPPVTVPASAGVDRLPVHLHWGLNRVKLDIAGSHPTGQVLELGDMELVHA